MTASTRDRAVPRSPSKAKRANGADAAPAAPLRLPDPRLTAGPKDSPVHHVRVALDTRLRALVKHESVARAGKDIEGVHQMRVSVRRMRAALKAARPLLDTEWADGLRAELGWLGRGLGPVRDLDVLLPRLRHLADDLPESERAAADRLVGALDIEHAEARAEMLAALSSPRYVALLERLADAVRLPLPTPTATEATPELIDLVKGEYRVLRKAVRRAGDDPPDEVLHALRIKTKRLRYTGELAEPALGQPVTRLLAVTEGLQEVLGDHQDACVAQHRLRELVAGLGESPDPALVLVAGRLIEREYRRADQLRAQWAAAWGQVVERAQDL